MLRTLYNHFDLCVTTTAAAPPLFLFLLLLQYYYYYYSVLVGCRLQSYNLSWRTQALSWKLHWASANNWRSQFRQNLSCSSFSAMACAVAASCCSKWCALWAEDGNFVPPPYSPDIFRLIFLKSKTKKHVRETTWRAKFCWRQAKDWRNRRYQRLHKMVNCQENLTSIREFEGCQGLCVVVSSL